MRSHAHEDQDANISQALLVCKDEEDARQEHCAFFVMRQYSAGHLRRT